jgi:hypothetical protein
MSNDLNVILSAAKNPGFRKKIAQKSGILRSEDSAQNDNVGAGAVIDICETRP